MQTTAVLKTGLAKLTVKSKLSLVQQDVKRRLLFVTSVFR